MKPFEKSLKNNLKSVINDELGSCEEQGRQEVWERLQQKLVIDQQSPQPFVSRRKQSIIAMVVLGFIGISALFFPQQVSAVGRFFTERILIVLEEGLVNEIIYPISTPGSDPHTPEKAEAQQLDSLEAARAVSPFPLLEPETLPLDYTFTGGSIIHNDNQAIVTIRFAGQSEQSQSLTIRQTNSTADTSVGLSYDPSDRTIKPVKIGEYNGTIILDAGHTTLIWVYYDLLIEMWAPLSEEEIISIAKSMLP